ncbi:unnamed protein product [Phaedon cochleariae]|uniref:AT-rich interactive domain-containing protein 2 n=1 Tax=Phaedon cochleariae TaxID=80249 RepID=A0A9N9X2Z9_PHACE|nr:unnamed protein product [Phaedon cochleariae]
MAKILGKDQSTYLKERDAFLRDLQHFHEIRGTPFKRPPTLGGKEVDLYLLYNLVISQGGWLRVNNKNSWSEILPSLNLPISCVNGSIGLKQTYLRYLDRWEKVHFLHEEADRGSDDDEESRHKRWSAKALHSVPYTYNYAQHNINETNREYHHLSTNLYKSSDYDRLALSLISPLPNEQDFAINVCTLLSNDGKHTLKLDKHPRLVDFLLGHAGIFNHASLRRIFTHYYRDVRKRPTHSFWKDMLASPEFLDLADEEKFQPKAEEPSKPLLIGDGIDPALLALQTPMDIEENRVNRVDSDSDCELDEAENNNCDSFKLKLREEDGDLFCLRRSLGTQDYTGQRVLQIATILRNLSFIEENVPVLVKNSSFLRFMLLCSSSRWNVLRNLGTDMLSNMSADFLVKELNSDILTSSLIEIVTRGLDSEDRACCLSSLEVLNKLSQNERNEDVMLRSLQFRVYKSVCSFLTIHDVMLLIYTLECLYSLSSLGERACNFIVNNHGVIDTLVSLVTVEGKSYGPKACIGMKLVETLPSSGQTQSQGQQQGGSVPVTTSGGTAGTSVANSPPSALTTMTSTTAASTPIVSSVATASARVVVAPGTPVRPVAIVPQRLIPITPTSTTTTTTLTAPATAPPPAPPTAPMTPQQLIQQQHAHQQAIQENEHFALAWLRATYEPSADGRVDHQELYRHYMGSCAKIGRRGVISPLHFPRCVRSIFGGTVGPNPMKPANPNDPQFYDGIKVRDHPLVITLPASCTALNSSPPSPSPTLPKTLAKGQQARRKSAQQALKAPPTCGAASAHGLAGGLATAHGLAGSLASAQGATTGLAPAPLEVDSEVGVGSPSSPILKAQLSAPPKPRDGAGSPGEAGGGDAKSQASSHPHLSQALLGANAATAPATTNATPACQVSGAGKDNHSGSGQTSSTSLIKSLLATKVNDCMSSVSMRTASDCQSVAQVAARQQRLLAQQTAPTSEASQQKKEPPKVSRMNGVRQLFVDNEVGDPSVSSTTQFTSLTKGKKEPPQPPPPPLAPLSNNAKGGKTQRIDNEDSDSIGNNSLASSSGLGTIGIGGVSSTEDGDNSLTSFEGLLNGIPNIDNPLNEDSNSKDYVKSSSETSTNKPLRLADLLEKKFEKGPPLLNGTLGKESKSVDLVENHIEKALNRDGGGHAGVKAVEEEEVIEIKEEVIEIKEEVIEIKEEPLEKPSLKRSASDDLMEVEPKKPLLSTVNGSTTAAAASTDPPDSSSSNSEEGPSTVSTAAAKLFADIAADILEDEDEEQLLQQDGGQGQYQQPQQQPPPQQQQIIVDHGGQHRQIIVSQPQMQGGGQVVITTGTPMKTQMGQTVIVQNSSTAQQRPVMLQQANAGQFLLSQGPQGQMQLVASSQPGQYVLQTGPGGQNAGQYVLQTGPGGQNAGQYVLQTGSHGGQNAYMVAQPQTAVVHGQQQTVLVAQTQQGGAPGKTIIILQQQTGGQATHHQKVVVTPQGQQMVVTQVPRPIVHTSSVSNSVTTLGKTVKTMSASATNGVGESKHDEAAAKFKVVRDLTTAYVCEWGDCLTEKKFRSANEVFMHACATHCPSGSEEITCQWDRCDNMKRKRFSLMTHLQDKHCTTEAMKQSLARRKKAAQGAKVETPAPSTSNSHPGYAPDAALHAIKRHALEFVNPKELQMKTAKAGSIGLAAIALRPGPSPATDQDDNEGPVTKSIRLTASLILRNLVIYSSHCKRYLKSYESHLANVALSNVESSRTIAQVLYDMNDGTTHR